MRAKLTITVGLLYRPAIRRVLDQMKFDDDLDDWSESKGFLQSDFHITGDALVLSHIKDVINKYEN